MAASSADGKRGYQAVDASGLGEAAGLDGAASATGQRSSRAAAGVLVLLLVLSVATNLIQSNSASTMAESLAAALRLAADGGAEPPAAHAFSVSYPAGAAAAATLDGRIYLLLSTLPDPEPRFQVREVAATTVHIFGQDVDEMRAGDVVELTTAAGAVGFPARKLEDVSPGVYYAQAVLVTYESFHLATGQTVKLPSPDRGDGMHWTRAPGNLYSTAERIEIGAGLGNNFELSMSNVMPPIPNQGIVIRTNVSGVGVWADDLRNKWPRGQGEDTQYVKHMRVASPLLSAFWGREMWLGAIVLLPEGFDEHPEARYPLMIHHVSPTNTRSITSTYGAYSGAYAMNHSMMNSNRDESSFAPASISSACGNAPNALRTGALSERPRAADDAARHQPRPSIPCLRCAGRGLAFLPTMDPGAGLPALSDPANPAPHAIL